MTFARALALTLIASGSTVSASAQSDSVAIASVIERFHTALAAADSTSALALLAPDVTVLESGGAETRDEYRSHHLPGDIAFARAVPRTRAPIRITIVGDVAWASSTSITQGEFRGRPINSASAELIVLTRSASGWLIRAIHWSSRTRK